MIFSTSKNKVAFAMTILGNIVNDKSPEVDSVYLLAKGGVCSFVRGNRFSRIEAIVDQTDLEFQVKIPYNDMASIVKMVDATFECRIDDKKLTIIGEGYQYEIQQEFFVDSAILSRVLEGQGESITFHNNNFKHMFEKVCVASANRVPPILDSLYLHEGQAYCTHVSILSQTQENSNDHNIEGDICVPFFIAQLACKLDDLLETEIFFGNKLVSCEFKLPDSGVPIVVADCSYLEGNYPIGQIMKTWTEVGKPNRPVSVVNKDFLKAIKKISAVNKTGQSAVSMKTEGNQFHISQHYSEKGVDVYVDFNDIRHIDIIESFSDVSAYNDTYSIDTIKFPSQFLSKALKNMEAKVFISVFEGRYLLVYDEKVSHIIPLMS